MSDERPKKSWSEIDKARDKGTTRREPGSGPKTSARAAAAQKQYKAALDRLFDTGEAKKLLGQKAADPKTDSRLAKIRAVRDAIGRDDISKAVDALLAEGGSLPPDEDVLTQAIEHRDEAKARLALAALLSWLDKNRPRRQATLKARLSGMVDNARDEDTQDLARQVLAKL